MFVITIWLISIASSIAWFASFFTAESHSQGWVLLSQLLLTIAFIMAMYWIEFRCVDRKVVYGSPIEDDNNDKRPPDSLLIG